MTTRRADLAEARAILTESCRLVERLQQLVERDARRRGAFGHHVGICAALDEQRDAAEQLQRLVARWPLE